MRPRGRRPSRGEPFRVVLELEHHLVHESDSEQEQQGREQIRVVQESHVHHAYCCWQRQHGPGTKQVRGSALDSWWPMPEVQGTCHGRHTTGIEGEGIADQTCGGTEDSRAVHHASAQCIHLG